MRGHIALLACVLLLFTLTAFVSCVDAKSEFKVMKLPDEIKVTCKAEGSSIYKGADKWERPTMAYSDENTGEYACKKDGKEEEEKIFIKFRTCDNCIQLDTASVIAMVVGNLVATGVIGVSVYLVASPSQTTTSLDRQHLIPHNSSSSSSRDPNSHYQPLRLKGDKDTYDVLSK
ncbi:uncharacterized protein LOC142995408 isoform X2 [Genypterus blacodes]|uniref:uncharacterized protein LOC142995408 isoform X2 n=1 Tax=Genypterus blacodes TaxID=154954 RepID=UPI003F75AF9A